MTLKTLALALAKDIDIVIYSVVQIVSIIRPKLCCAC